MIVVLASWAPPLVGRQCERLKKKNTEFSSGSVGHIHCLGFKSASSCVRRGGPTWKRPGRTSGTGRGGALCVFGSAWSVHLSGRTSTHSHPSHSGKASHLCGFAGVP
jgi:hypothetical protein